MNNGLSFVARSCLFTKGCAAKRDKRQRVRKSYMVPNNDTRKHLAEMILEEALETVKALGWMVRTRQGGQIESMEDVLSLTYNGQKFDLEQIIDGACDTIYVCTGALVACGVPDIPHLQAVCQANDRKFPDGQARIDPTSGKYLKPLGWTPPNHVAVKTAWKEQTDMIKLTKDLIVQGNSNEPGDQRGLQPVSSRFISPSGDGALRDQSRCTIPGNEYPQDQEAHRQSEQEITPVEDRPNVDKEMARKRKPRV